MSCSEWKKVRLAEVLEPKGYIRGPFGSALRRNELQESGIPVYEQQNAIYNHRNFRFYVNNIKYDELKRFTVKENDMMISCSGTIGRVSMIQRDDPVGIISQALLLLRCDNKKINPKFFYYFLTSTEGQNAIASVSSGSVQVNIAKRNIVENINILLPPISEQKEIAATLSCLDDKIELNSRINKNLEEMAQAIFKRWFVDFEFPDENGNPYKSSGGEMVESELGEIPKEWKSATLDDVCLKITDGSHYSPKESTDGTYPMLSVKDMESYGFNYKSCKMIGENDYKRMILNDCVPITNDVLVAKDGSYMKHVFIVNENRKEAILSSIAIFRPKSSKIFPEILLCLLKDPIVQQKIKDNYVSGSALPRIVLKDFKKLALILPSMTDQLKIFPLLSGIRQQIAENQSENIALSDLRDSLLSKLMSGEIALMDVLNA